MRQTIEAGEFQMLERALPLAPGLANRLDDAERRWTDQPNQITAAELVSGALVLGNPEVSVPAAQYLSRSASSAMLRSLGLRALDPSSTAGLTSTSEGVTSESFEEQMRRLLLRKIAERVNRDPRNALAQASMARRYTILGQLEQADRALSMALAFAPSSRYVRRIACRFYVHLGDPLRAFTLLDRFGRTAEIRGSWQRSWPRRM